MSFVTDDFVRYKIFDEEDSVIIVKIKLDVEYQIIQRNLLATSKGSSLIFAVWAMRLYSLVIPIVSSTC